MTATYLPALGVVCALGRGQQAVAAALFAGDTAGMQAQVHWIADRSVTVGAVGGELAPLPAALAAMESRNNRLLLAAASEIETAVHAAIARCGAHRVGVVIGTSTSGIHEAGQAIAGWVAAGQPTDHHYAAYAQQEMAAPAEFVAALFATAGPVYALSTACTSSARALLSAQRLLQQGVCDAVICGGADSLCALTLNGFHALEAIAEERCNPFSANRRGINIGEAAALFLMTRAPDLVPGTRAPVALLGGGASSDAHHISAPDPTGRGAQQAMRAALAAAGVAPAEVDYLNLHGTATRHNDAMESIAVAEVFGRALPCSSTKPLTGHTLGAAGALEAAFCWLTLSDCNPDGRLPPHRWDGVADPALPPLALTTAASRLTRDRQRRLMSTSFAFGGSNVALLLGDAP